MTGIFSVFALTALIFFKILIDEHRYFWAKRAAARKVSKDGFNELMYGVVVKDDHIVRELLAAKLFDIDSTDDLGMTALMYAAMNDNGPAIQMLVEAGADASLKNKRGESAYRFATYYAHPELVDYLEKVSPYSETRVGARFINWIASFRSGHK